jgi:hypothetical protein
LTCFSFLLTDAIEGTLSLASFLVPVALLVQVAFLVQADLETAALLVPADL